MANAGSGIRDSGAKYRGKGVGAEQTAAGNGRVMGLELREIVAASVGTTQYAHLVVPAAVVINQHELAVSEAQRWHELMPDRRAFN